MFHMYDNKFISVKSHALYPLPLSQTVTPSRTPSTPSSVTYFMDGLLAVVSCPPNLSLRSFRSAHSFDLLVPKTWTILATQQELAVVGPSIWSELPCALRAG